MLKNVFLAYSSRILRKILLGESGKSVSMVIADVDTLISQFDQYSPAKLSERLPLFAVEPSGVRSSVSELLRQAFSRAFPPADRSALETACSEFKEAAVNFWRKCSSSDTEIEALELAYSRVQDCGVRLAENLEQLPKGIWLP